MEWQEKYKYQGGGAIALPLEEDTASYRYVMETATKNVLHPSVFQIVNYSTSEIEQSEYFSMEIKTPLEGDVLVDRRFIKKGFDDGIYR